MPQSSPQWKSLFKHMVVEMLKKKSKKNPTKLIFLWVLYVLELPVKFSFKSVDS